MNPWRIELLDKQHDCRSFTCGEESLDSFLRSYAGQNARKDISRTYVLVPDQAKNVCGFYTLSSGSLSYEDLPEEIARSLPRYRVPVVHLGRLALDQRYQGQGVGRLLLADACKRVRKLADAIGIHGITVRALDERARSFYLAFGFTPLLDDPQHLFLTMGTIRQSCRDK